MAEVPSTVEVLEASSEPSSKTHHGEQRLEQHQPRERGERAVTIEGDPGSGRGHDGRFLGLLTFWWSPGVGIRLVEWPQRPNSVL